MCRQQVCLHAPMLSRAFQLFALRSVSLMLCPVPKPLGAPLHLISGSVTMADRVVLKQHPRWQEPLDRFSNRGRSGGSQTRTWGTISTFCSATVADQVVLKPVGVDMPFDLGIPISKNCKICQVFLFLRPARSFFRSGSRISASVYSRPDGGMDPL